MAFLGQEPPAAAPSAPPAQAAVPMQQYLFPRTNPQKVIPPPEHGPAHGRMDSMRQAGGNKGALASRSDYRNQGATLNKHNSGQECSTTMYPRSVTPGPQHKRRHTGPAPLPAQPGQALVLFQQHSGNGISANALWVMPKQQARQQKQSALDTAQANQSKRFPPLPKYSYGGFRGEEPPCFFCDAKFHEPDPCEFSREGDDRTPKYGDDTFCQVYWNRGRNTNGSTNKYAYAEGMSDDAFAKFMHTYCTSTRGLRPPAGTRSAAPYLADNALPLVPVSYPFGYLVSIPQLKDGQRMSKQDLLRLLPVWGAEGEGSHLNIYKPRAGAAGVSKAQHEYRERVWLEWSRGATNVCRGHCMATHGCITRSTHLSAMCAFFTSRFLKNDQSAWEEAGRKLGVRVPEDLIPVRRIADNNRGGLLSIASVDEANVCITHACRQQTPGAVSAGRHARSASCPPPRRTRSPAPRRCQTAQRSASTSRAAGARASAVAAEAGSTSAAKQRRTSRKHPDYQRSQDRRRSMHGVGKTGGSAKRASRRQVLALRQQQDRALEGRVGQAWPYMCLVCFYPLSSLFCFGL